MMKSFQLSALVAAGVCGALWAPSALACGGLFCAAGGVVPQPVDQSAERILFEVNDDGSVTATVEIKYQGASNAFAWIVPVPGTPTSIDVADKNALALLDTITRPSILPPTTLCSNPPSGGGGFGCSDPLAAGSRGFEDSVDVPGEGVNVTDYPAVGPFDEIVVVRAEDPDALFNWLVEHNYNVTEAMRPFIAQYAGADYGFLAVRLAPTASVSDIVPLRFHCPRPMPEIPLRLTAVAADPELGILVFIAGATRYVPSNVDDVKLDTAALQADQFGNTNYFALISRELDAHGGQGFVTERAGSSADLALPLSQANILDVTGAPIDVEAARSEVQSLLSRRSYVTRLYSRMDPDEMLLDPVFVPEPNANDEQLDVSGTIDLSARTLELCPATGAPDLMQAPTCGTTYCGDGNACAGTEQGEGCICRNGEVARAIVGPTGLAAVSCMSRGIDMHGESPAACADVDCGLGSCVVVNDRPTCACADEDVAVVSAAGLRCEARNTDVYEADRISVWPAKDPSAAAVPAACGIRGNNLGGLVTLVALLGAGLLMRVPSWRRRMAAHRGTSL